MVGTVHDYGVGGGHIDTGFDNGGTHQHIKPLMIKITHYRLKFTLTHLTVAYGNAGFRHYFGDFLGGAGNAFYLVVQEIHLTAAQNFTHDGFAYYRFIALLYKGFNSQAFSRGGGNNG